MYWPSPVDYILAVPRPREGGLWWSEIFAYALLQPAQTLWVYDGLRREKKFWHRLAIQPARSVCVSLSAFLFLVSGIWQVIKRKQNEAKLLFRGYCPLCAPLRFIGALVRCTFGPPIGPARASPPPSGGSVIMATTCAINSVDFARFANGRN